MKTSNLCVGERLRGIRQNQGISLDEAAKRTGVSKPALAQVERGTSSPTVNTLWKIATGLKVPLSYLLQEQKKEFEVVDLEDSEPVLACGQAMRAYPVFPFDPTRNMEIFYIEFAAGCEHLSIGHLDGVEEYILVLSGALNLSFGSSTVTLKEKQAIRFQADVEHAYRNPFDCECNIYNMIFYPES